MQFIRRAILDLEGIQECSRVIRIANDLLVQELDTALTVKPYADGLGTAFHFVPVQKRHGKAGQLSWNGAAYGHGEGNRCAHRNGRLDNIGQEAYIR